jgi:hypothetical protein
MGEFLMVVPPDFTEITVGEQEAGNMVEIQQHVSNQDWPSLTFLLQQIGTITEQQSVTDARVFSVGETYRMWVMFGA